MYGIINAGVHFFPDLCSCVMRTSPFFLLPYSLQDRADTNIAQAVIFPYRVAKEKQNTTTDTECPPFIIQVWRKSLLITFAISVKVFWTHFETNWYNKVFSRCFNSLGFRTHLTYQLEPIYRYRKARNFRHVYPEKMPLFVVSSDKGERRQDSLLLSQLTFATITS